LFRALVGGTPAEAPRRVGFPAVQVYIFQGVRTDVPQRWPRRRGKGIE